MVERAESASNVFGALRFSTELIGAPEAAQCEQLGEGEEPPAEHDVQHHALG